MKRETLHFGRLPSLLLASSCVLSLECSLAVIRAGDFRFLTWTEAQQLSHNLAGLQGLLGITALADQIIWDFLTSPVWDNYCGTTQTASCKHSNKSPFNICSCLTNCSHQSTWLTQTLRSCRTPHLPPFPYTLACEVSGLYLPQTRMYYILDCNL